jgi:hypothetical protein
MPTNFGPGELIVILCVVLLLFGLPLLLAFVISQRFLSRRQHKELDGLSADDHPQYLPTDGSRPLTGDLNLAGHKLNNLTSAMAPGQAVPFQQALKNDDPAAGDLAGAYPSPRVTGLQGLPLSTRPPADGDVLRWNAAAGMWEPGLLPGAAPPVDDSRVGS